MPTKKSEHQILLEQVYYDLYPSLMIQGRMMGAPMQVVKDSIQDIFLSLLEKPDITSKIKNYRSYISLSMRRKVAKYLKKEFVELDYNHTQIQESYEKFIIDNQTNEVLQEKLITALSTLTPSQRNIIQLRFYGGMSYDDIAEHLDVKVRTVYNQFHSAMKILRSSNFIV